jgi:alternate signal-mediated exported protein
MRPSAASNDRERKHIACTRRSRLNSPVGVESVLAQVMIGADHRGPGRTQGTPAAIEGCEFANMNKSIKGLVAAGAAGLLLLGGAGSLAYWNAAGTVAGGTVNSGRLALVNPVAGSWVLNGTPVTGTITPVPGDQLAYTGSYEVDAVGDDLEATLGVNGGAASGTLVNFVTTSVAATVAGQPVTTVTEANDGDRLAVAVNVDFPFGSAVDNASQGKTLDLSAITVTLTQTDATS